MKRDKPKVGQEVFVIEREARKRQGLRKAWVTKVGRKYFYVNEYSNKHDHMVIRFDIEKQFHDNGQYQSRYNVYFSEQEYMDEQKREKLCTLIYRTVVGNWHRALPIEALKQIADLLGIKEDEENNESIQV